MSLKGLRGRVAVVTGAAQGIGQATVTRLLEEGCKVVALDLNAAALEQFAGDPNVVTSAMDITNDVDCERSVAVGLKRFGAIHLLAHCAGVAEAFAPLAEMNLEAFDRLIAINLRGTMLMMRACLQPMIAQKEGGSIVCIASLAVVRGGATRSAYAASKRAVVGLTSVAALENGQHGIRINALAPGLVATPMMKYAASTDANLMAFLKTRPISRMAEPSEIASSIAWLLSEESSYVTGSVQLVDGGYTL